MTAKDLAKRARKRPFSPFRIIVSEGGSYDINHPEQIVVARDSVVIGVPGESDDFYETTDLVDLIHVVRLEPIPAQKAKGKN